MPYLPSNHKCAHFGCATPRSKLNTFCSEHGGKEFVSKESDSAYQTPAWRSVRQRQLSVQPLCQGCLSRGRVEQANHVDHVFPWRQIGKQAFMHNIFQSLCQACHSYKTGQEKQGVYEHYTTEGVRLLNKHDYSTSVRVNPR